MSRPVNYSNANPVWITGLGAVSAAGVGIKPLLHALQNESFCGTKDDSPLPVPWVARCTEPLPLFEQYPDDRKSVLGHLAVEQAMHHAGDPKVDPKRLAVYLGTGLSSITPAQLAQDFYPHLVNGRFDRHAMAKDLATDRAAPRRHQPQRLTHCIRDQYRSLGPTGTSFSACAAAAQAIEAGMRAIHRGHADVAIVGGHDSMDHPMGLLSFIVLGALSETRCRPFDANRDGFMLGEGAAVLILESEKHARCRGAVPLARLLGAGTSLDAHNATAPHPDGRGAELAMRRALLDAGLSPKDVSLIHSHGTATPLGDRAESLAIQRLFGSDTSVVSTKGSHGHLIAAAGAIEAVISVMCLQSQFVPGTVGLENRDSSCPVSISPHSRDEEISVVVSNSFGFGGQNCTLLFGR